MGGGIWGTSWGTESLDAASRLDRLDRRYGWTDTPVQATAARLDRLRWDRLRWDRLRWLKRVQTSIPARATCPHPPPPPPPPPPPCSSLIGRFRVSEGAARYHEPAGPRAGSRSARPPGGRGCLGRVHLEACEPETG